MAQLVKNLPAMQETGFSPWFGKILWRKERLPTLVFWPREFHGLYSPWGRYVSDPTEQLSFSVSLCQLKQKHFSVLPSILYFPSLILILYKNFNSV